MDGGSKSEISCIVTGDLDSTPAVHIDTSGKLISPTLLTTHPNKPSGSTLSSPITLNFGTGFADSCADEDQINAFPPTPSLIRFVLGNFFFATSLIFLTLFIVFFAVTWFTVLWDARLMRDQVLSDVNGVSILGQSLQLDLDARVLSISWEVVVCGVPTTSDAPSLDGVHVPANCKPLDKALDVYINEYVQLRSTAQSRAWESISICRSSASLSPSKPILSFIPHTELVSQRLSVWDPPRFTVEHQFDKYAKWDPTEDLLVPFKHYSFHAFAFAIDPITNHSVDITMFSVTDTLGDFIVCSHNATDTVKFTYESGGGLMTMEVKSRVLRAEIKRSVIAKASAICLFFGGWAVAVASVYVTALVASERLDTDNIVAALPFSALVAIPAIRSLYISSPSLGISVDAVAFLVQMTTIGLCCLALLRIFTRYRSSCPTGFPV